MPAFFRYDFVILGSASHDGNNTAIDYTSYPTGTWSYSGPTTSFVVEERNQNNADFDGDKPPDQVQKKNQIDRGNEQTTDIGGTKTQLLWDYSFQISDPNTGDTWEIGVVDVDLNNDNNVNDTTEAGYYLIFIDGVPPPDVVYTIDSITADETETLHTDLGGVAICFASGTLIDTPDGPRRVETLLPGDFVVTRDAGAQPVRWAGWSRLFGYGKAAPVVIPNGALRNNADLIVSPQHAILLKDWRAELLFGASEVLVRAIDLVGHKGIYSRFGGVVRYHHILLDQHHLIKAAGIWSESLYPGDVAQRAMGQTARDEINMLVPDIEAYGPKAAPCLRRFEVECLAA